LVRPLAVVVRDVLGDRSAKVALAEQDQPVEALLADRAHPVLSQYSARSNLQDL